MLNIFFLSSDWGCYLIIAAILVSYMLFFHIKRYAFRRLLLIRLNYTIIFVCITIILAYIVSLNSNVLSSYDKSPPLYYNFLNPYDAIRFPFDQLKIINGQFDPTILNFNSNDSLSKPHYLIIVDKTRSTDLPGSMLNTVESLKSTIKAAVQSSNEAETFEKEPQGKFDAASIDHLDLRDLVVLYFLRTLYNNSSPSKEFSYQILLYYGNDQFGVGGLSSERPNTNAVTVAEAFRIYIDAIKKAIPPQSQKTNFKDILKQFAEKKYIKNNNGITNAVIISDFQHEPISTGVSFDELEKSISNNEIVKNDFKLSLYRLSNNKPLNDSCTKTIEIINSNFLNTKTYYFDEKTVIDDPKHYQEYLNSLFSSTVNMADNINFFYPDKNFKRITSASGLCCIPYNPDGYIFNFNNQNLPFTHNHAFLKINDCEILTCNENKVIDLPQSKGDIMTLELFLNKNIQQDNYLDISAPGKLCMHSYRMNILEKVPKSSIVIMCICYIIILLVFLCNSITYIICAFKSLLYGGNYFHFGSKQELEVNATHAINNISKLELFLLLILQSYIIIWVVVVLTIIFNTFYTYYPTLTVFIIIIYSVYLVSHIFWKIRNFHLSN